MKKLRLGVIGAGSWTVMSHLPNLERHRDDVEFVAVNRLGADHLRKVKSMFGFEYASEDYRDVLAQDCDIVVVGSPPNLHHEHAKAALASGAHVLCEKPFTLTPADAWELVEFSQRVEKNLVVSFGFNYLPMVEEAKRLLDASPIGDIEHLTVHMASVTRELLLAEGPYPEASADVPPDSATWTVPEISGGGYAHAQLSHALGLALWLTGLRGAEAFSLLSKAHDAPVELHAAIGVLFTNGAVGSVSGGSSHVGTNDNREQLLVRGIGSEGQFLVDLEREAVWLYRSDGRDIRLAPSDGAGTYDCVGPIDALVELARGRGRNDSPGELGARTVEILDAAYRSARSGRRETIAA